MSEPTLDNVTLAFYDTKDTQAAAGNAMMFGLTGPYHARTRSLDADVNHIGRSSSCEIQIASPAVSSHHCTISREGDGRYVIVDEGSRNGTEVNGRPLVAGKRLQLAHGDNISICGNTFLFLNPRAAADDDLEGEIKIDRAKIRTETSKMLEECQQFANLRRSRRSDASSA